MLTYISQIVPPSNLEQVETAAITRITHPASRVATKSFTHASPLYMTWQLGLGNKSLPLEGLASRIRTASCAANGMDQFDRDLVRADRHHLWLARLTFGELTLTGWDNQAMVHSLFRAKLNSDFNSEEKKKMAPAAGQWHINGKYSLQAVIHKALCKASAEDGIPRLTRRLNVLVLASHCCDVSNASWFFVAAMWTGSTSIQIMAYANYP